MYDGVRTSASRYAITATLPAQRNPLSLHDALPICTHRPAANHRRCKRRGRSPEHRRRGQSSRSEEHTSELQSQSNLVCRLLLEKKKTTTSSNRKTMTSSHTSYERCSRNV